MLFSMIFNYILTTFNLYHTLHHIFYNHRLFQLLSFNSCAWNCYLFIFFNKFEFSFWNYDINFVSNEHSYIILTLSLSLSLSTYIYTRTRTHTQTVHYSMHHAKHRYRLIVCINDKNVQYFIKVTGHTISGIKNPNSIQEFKKYQSFVTILLQVWW